MPRCQNWKAADLPARRRKPAAQPDRAQSQSSTCSRCRRVKPNGLLRLQAAPELGPRRMRIVCAGCSR